MASLNNPSVGFDAMTGRILTGWDHVLQSLSDIFTTGFGERVIREWYGSFVPTLLGQLITPEEVMSQLREQGMSSLDEVREAFLEGDGQISFVKREGKPA